MCYLQRSFISNSILGVNVRVAQQIYVFKVKGSLGVTSFQDLSVSKIFNNFSVITSIYPKYYCTQLSCQKLAEKFCFSELKTEKVKFFTRSSTKIVSSCVFNVEACLGSSLMFRPFLKLDHQQLGCLYKKNVYLNVVKNVCICSEKSGFCVFEFKYFYPFSPVLS